MRTNRVNRYQGIADTIVQLRAFHASGLMRPCHPIIDDGGQGDFAALAAKVELDLELRDNRKLQSIEGERMSNEKAGSAASASRALQPTEPNPLDFVPDKIPFDTPYGAPISLDRAQEVIHAAVAEAKKRDWKMNLAVVDSGGNLVAFQRMDGAMLASIQIAEHKARAAATFRRPTKVFEDCWPSMESLLLAAAFR
jgi:hypothetical protein